MFNLLSQPTFIELEEGFPFGMANETRSNGQRCFVFIYTRLKLDWPTENNAPLAHHFQRFSRGPQILVEYVSSKHCRVLPFWAHGDGMPVCASHATAHFRKVTQS